MNTPYKSDVELIAELRASKKRNAPKNHVDLRRSRRPSSLPRWWGYGVKYRHKKRGSEYVLIGFGRMQAENWIEGGDFTKPQSIDMHEVAIYRSVDDGSLWVRPREEFEDGRFELLPSTANPMETGTRDQRQQTVAKWCAAAFGADHQSPVPQRGLRMLEEAMKPIRRRQEAPRSRIDWSTTSLPRSPANCSKSLVGSASRRLRSPPLRA